MAEPKIDLKQVISDMSKPKSEVGNEYKPRLSPTILMILNKQIENELYSSQLYRSIASWLDDKGWANTAKVFFKYADEELEHMRKIYQYLYERNCKAIVPTHKEVPQSFDSYRSVFELGLNHEFGVTANWETIARIAKDEGCHTTMFFSEWFLKEQTTEENKFRDILFKLNQNMPEWYMEQNIEQIAGN